MSNKDSSWWRKYPPSGCPHQQLQLYPAPGQTPAFKVGDVVRLKDKPDKPRKAIDVSWHVHCYDFVYVVETFTRRTPSYVPYWYASQLVPEDARGMESGTNGEEA